MLPKPFDLARLIDLLGSLLALDWVERAPGPAVPAPAPESPAALAPADLAELGRLCAIGYVRGLDAKLGEVGDAPVVAALRERLARFDLDGFARLLDEAAGGRATQDAAP